MLSQNHQEKEAGLQAIDLKDKIAKINILEIRNAEK